MDTFIANRRSLDAVSIDTGFSMHEETKPASELPTSHFSPRDREASSDPPLVGGSELGLAGQASPASLGRNALNLVTHLTRNDAIASHHPAGIHANALLESELASNLELKSGSNSESNTHLKRKQ